MVYIVIYLVYLSDVRSIQCVLRSRHAAGGF